MAIHVLDINKAEKTRYVTDAATDVAVSARLKADTVNRINILPGKIELGSGTGAVDTNLYRAAANALGTDDAMRVADGTVSVPSVSFVSGASCGLFRQGTNSLSVAAGGAELARFNANGTGLGISGTAAVPSVYFTNQVSTGIATLAANTLGVIASGAEQARVVVPGTSAFASLQLTALVGGSLTALKQVYLDAADSASTGYRHLMVAN